MEWGEITALVVAGGALLTAIAGWSRSRGEVRRNDLVEARRGRAAAAAAAAKAYEDMEELREQLRTTRDAEEECARRVTELRERLSLVEAVLPFILVEDQLRNVGWIAEVLDAAADCWVVSSSAAEGSWVFVNARLCEVLGLGRDALLAAGWRALVHPDDLAKTQIAEGRAWTGTTRIVNRFRTASGGWAQLRWIAPPYAAGVTLALARFEGYVTDVTDSEGDGS